MEADSYSSFGMFLRPAMLMRMPPPAPHRHMMIRDAEHISGPSQNTGSMPNIPRTALSMPRSRLNRIFHIRPAATKGTTDGR